MPGVKAMEVFLALQKNAIEGVSGAGWGENRAAWLGGQVASNVSWQDSGTQASRPDQSQIVGDSITIFEPRVEGGRFAPTNIAGSTSCVAATSQNPEGAFLMLAFLTTASIMAMNEANANGVAPGYRSVLSNPNLQAVSPPSEGLGGQPRARLVRAAHSRHVRDGAGARQRDQPRARRADLGQGGARQRQRRLEEDHGEERLLLRERALHLCRLQARGLGRRRQAAAVLMAETRRHARDAGAAFKPLRRSRRTLTRRSPAMRKALPYLLVAPAVIYLLMITLYPGVFAIWQSFYIVRFNKMIWPGVANYQMLLGDREFWAALGNTVIIGGIALVARDRDRHGARLLRLSRRLHPRLAHRLPDADAVHALGRRLHLEARLQRRAGDLATS